jgi:hypothetical protein
LSCIKPSGADGFRKKRCRPQKKASINEPKGKASLFRSFFS